MANFLQKNKKAILIGGGILVAGIVIYFLIRKKKNLTPELSQTAKSDTSVTTTPEGVVFPIVRKLGADTNEAERQVIANIQKYLNTKITFVEFPLTVDGIFGAKTEAMAQRILGVKTISYSLYKEILGKLNLSPYLTNI